MKFRLLILMVAYMGYHHVSAQKYLYATNYTLDKNGLIYVPVFIDGKGPYNFLVHSGVDQSLIISTRIPELFEEEHKAKPKSYRTGNEVSVMMQFQTIGSLKSEFKLRIEEIGRLEDNSNQQIDGVLGLDFFQSYTVDFDHIQKKMKVFDPKTYQYTGLGYTLKTEVNKGNVYVGIDWKDYSEMSGQFLISSGTNVPWILMDWTVSSDRKGSESDRLLSFPYLFLEDGNYNRVSAGKVQLGGFAFENEVGVSLPAENYKDFGRNISGIIGAQALHNFMIVYDFANDRLFIERYSGTKNSLGDLTSSMIENASK